MKIEPLSRCHGAEVIDYYEMAKRIAERGGIPPPKPIYRWKFCGKCLKPCIPEGGGKRRKK